MLAAAWSKWEMSDAVGEVGSSAARGRGWEGRRPTREAEPGTMSWPMGGEETH